jgi:hypothetical protein
MFLVITGNTKMVHTSSISLKACVADPGCLSWIPDIDLFPVPGSRIPDSTITPKQEGKMHSLIFFCSHKFTKFLIL